MIKQDIIGGEKRAETDKAINIGGLWIPRSIIREILVECNEDGAARARRDGTPKRESLIVILSKAIPTGGGMSGHYDTFAKDKEGQVRKFHYWGFKGLVEIHE